MKTRLGRVCVPRQVTHGCIPRSCSAWQRLYLPACTADEPHQHKQLSIKLEKRAKQYFFKLLFAARKRDRRLLKVVLKAFSQDEDFRRMRSSFRSKNLPYIDDVLLKAASRCGQVSLAESVFEVRSRDAH